MDTPGFEPSTLSIVEWLIDMLTHSATKAQFKIHNFFFPPIYNNNFFVGFYFFVFLLS